MKKVPLEERFWNKVEIKNPDDCWNWNGGKHGRGYGFFYTGREPYWTTGKGRSMSFAHRVSYEMAYGNIPNGLEVCHSCDNTSCVNPFHLFLGTHEENVKDMDSKKRCKRKLKITNEIAQEIILSPLSNKKLADLFMLDSSYIYRIKNGKSRYWKDLFHKLKGDK